MPLDERAVGQHIGSIELDVRPRWTMAYAAGVPDERPALYDTVAGPLVHPVFAVAPEWELLMAARTSAPGMTADEVRRGVHVDHDLVLDAPLPADARVRVAADVVAVDRRRAGATQTIVFTATSVDGAPLWRSRMTSLFLGVELLGDPRSADEWPAAPDAPSAPSGGAIAVRRSPVRTIDAQVYSECAHIWNPIHTDVVAARRAGLAAPILHGTASLARGVSIASELAGVDLGAVVRVRGRFGAMVELGTEIEVALLGSSADGCTLAFEVRTAEGRTAIADGLVVTAPDE